MAPSDSDGEVYDVIFVPSFFHRGLGRVIYASSYGKKCFALRVRRQPPQPANDVPSTKTPMAARPKRSRKPKKKAA